MRKTIYLDEEDKFITNSTTLRDNLDEDKFITNSTTLRRQSRR